MSKNTAELKLFSFCQENKNNINMLGASIPRPSQIGPICTFTSSINFHLPAYFIFDRLLVSITQETPNEILLSKQKSICPIRNACENISICNIIITHKGSNYPIPVNPWTKHHPSFLTFPANLNHISGIEKFQAWKDLICSLAGSIQILDASILVSAGSIQPYWHWLDLSRIH